MKIVAIPPGGSLGPQAFSHEADVCTCDVIIFIADFGQFDGLTGDCWWRFSFVGLFRQSSFDFERIIGPTEKFRRHYVSAPFGHFAASLLSRIGLFAWNSTVSRGVLCIYVHVEYCNTTSIPPKKPNET